MRTEKQDDELGGLTPILVSVLRARMKAHFVYIGFFVVISVCTSSVRAELLGGSYSLAWNMEELLEHYDDRLASGVGVYPKTGDLQINLHGEPFLYFEMMNATNAPLISKYASRWLPVYSEVFPEVGLLSALGGADERDLLPYYRKSNSSCFRRMCEVAFCLSGVSVPDESVHPYVKNLSDLYATLSASTNNHHGIDIMLTISNSNPEVRYLLFSGNSWGHDLLIERSDKVPVIRRDDAVVVAPDVDSTAVEKAVGRNVLSPITLQPSSTVIRSIHIDALGRREFLIDPDTYKEPDRYVNTYSILDAYVTKQGSVYSLFETWVAGKLDSKLVVDIRYSYDFTHLSSYVEKLGYLDQPKRGRVESNTIRLTFDENGKFVSFSSGKAERSNR